MKEVVVVKDVGTFYVHLFTVEGGQEVARYVRPENVKKLASFLGYSLVPGVRPPGYVNT